MFWTRKFGEPLRQTFQADIEDDSDEFLHLLAQADQRRGSPSQTGGQSEGA
jgi:hypothetical protein